MGDDHAEDLRKTARSYVGAAFEALKSEDVIPTPLYHPFVRVGRDYFGDSVSAMPEYRAFEAALNAMYPKRFAHPAEDPPYVDFASSYIFSFLEACVARCGGRGERGFSTESPAIDISIDELLAALAPDPFQAVCCRFVSHLTTASGSPVQVGDIAVVPDAADRGHLTRRIAAEIPGAYGGFNREDPRPYDPPHSLLIAKRSATTEPFAVCRELSSGIERFLLNSRLLTAGTFDSYYEVHGLTTLVSRMTPRLVDFGKGWLDSPLRRTTTLTGDESEAFEALGAMIDTADVNRDKMAATSFDVALAKFRRSHSNPFERLVDLATALEAILLGGDKDNDAITLRLKTRAAALLATDNDPAKSVFDDVGTLYSLRSTLIHGGQIKQATLQKEVSRISTVNDTRMFGIAVGHAVDRMRDLVRRSILARLCLASGPDPLWPFANYTPVDASLTDDEQRAVWRTRWRERMAQIGAAEAADPPRPAVWVAATDDR